MKNKLHININRPEPTQEEIREKMDFEGLMLDYQNVPIPPSSGFSFFNLSVILPSTAVIVALLVTLFFVFKKKEVAPVAETPVLESISPEPEKTSFINPLVPELDPAFYIFKFDASRGGEFTFASGSTIKVPPHAFVDSAGNKVTGEAELLYREMVDPAGFILAGIPLDYDSAGTSYIFHSGGMFELYARNTEGNLQVESGSQLEVDFVTTYQESFNRYYFNNQSGNWEYLSHAAAEEPNENPLPKQKVATVENDIPEQQEIKQLIKKLEEEKPVAPKKLNSNAYQFDFEMDLSHFPYLSSFQGVLFEVVDGQNFNPEVFNQFYTDAKIREVSKGIYEITLYQGERQSRYEVYPVFEESDFAAAMKVYEAEIAKHNKKIEAEKKRQEQLMAAEERRRNAEVVQQNRRQRSQSSGVGMQGTVQRGLRAVNFAISRTGLYNIDKPVRIEPVLAEAYFMLDNSPLNKNVFWMPGNINSIRMVNTGDILYSFPGTVVRLLSIDPENREVVISNQSIPTGSRNFTFEFTRTGRILKEDFDLVDVITNMK